MEQLPKSAGKVGYCPQVDSLRAIAVAMVAWSHWMPKDLSLNLPLGSLGVQIFFAISGFLITAILLNNRSPEGLSRGYGHELRAFYARRFLRIFPVYYALIIVGALLGHGALRETSTWSLTYLTNFYFYSAQSWHGDVSHFWSLAVEEQFYLFWPMVILFVPGKLLKPTVLAFCLFDPAFRIWHAIATPEARFVQCLPWANFLTLCGGSFLAIHWSRARNLHGGAITCVLVASAALAVYLRMGGGQSLPGFLPGVGEYVGWAVFSVFVVWLLAKGLPGRAGAMLSSRPLVYLGSISYGMYLFHNFTDVISPGSIVQAVGFDGSNPWAKLVVCAGFTFVVSAASYHLFEAPINMLKRRFPYKRRATDRPAAASIPSSVVASDQRDSTI